MAKRPHGRPSGAIPMLKSLAHERKQGMSTAMSEVATDDLQFLHDIARTWGGPDATVTIKPGDKAVRMVADADDCGMRYLIILPHNGPTAAVVCNDGARFLVGRDLEIKETL